MASVLVLSLLLHALLGSPTTLTSIHHGDKATFWTDSLLSEDSAVGPANCLPFGYSYYGHYNGYKGFIYANIPPFTLRQDDRIAFDLGAENDVAISLDIAIASTAVNGGGTPANDDDGDGSGEGFTTICRACEPLSPKGNDVQGDYELEFRLNEPGVFFTHAALGGLIIRFKAVYPFELDATCTSTLMEHQGIGLDAPEPAESYFVSRFYSDADGKAPWQSTDTHAIAGFALFGSAPTTKPTPAPSHLPLPTPTKPPFPPPSAPPHQLPTAQPTPLPTVQPTSVPTHVPSPGPSPAPSVPTVRPTPIPTVEPTVAPSHSPTTQPIPRPTPLPTTSSMPSQAPSHTPTSPPSRWPTHLPTVEPSSRPTGSHRPTLAPSETAVPSSAPSKSPRPTTAPSTTPRPTSAPSPSPSLLPTLAPSPGPTTPLPTDRPTLPPTSHPSQLPSAVPSLLPTPLPTPTPTTFSERTVRAEVACTGLACEAAATLDIASAVPDVSDLEESTSDTASSRSRSSGSEQLLWTRVGLSVTRLRGDLGSAGQEYVTVFVAGQDTGVRCSTLRDCGAPLGMEHPDSGEDCVLDLNVSEFIGRFPTVPPSTMNLEVALKASSFVNFCSPYYVAADVAVTISFVAVTPGDDDARDDEDDYSGIIASPSRAPTPQQYSLGPSVTLSPLPTPPRPTSSPTILASTPTADTTRTSPLPTTSEPSLLPTPVAIASSDDDELMPGSSDDLDATGANLSENKTRGDGQEHHRDSDSTTRQVLMGCAVVLSCVATIVGVVIFGKHRLERDRRRAREWYQPRHERHRHEAQDGAGQRAHLDDGIGNLSSRIPARPFVTTRYAYEATLRQQAASPHATTRRRHLRRSPSTPMTAPPAIPVATINALDRTCSICMEDVHDLEIAKELACRHVFHAACLDAWLARSISCPNCKRTAVAAPSSIFLRCRGRWLIARRCVAKTCLGRVLASGVSDLKGERGGSGRLWHFHTSRRRTEGNGDDADIGGGGGGDGRSSVVMAPAASDGNGRLMSRLRHQRNRDGVVADVENLWSSTDGAMVSIDDFLDIDLFGDGSDTGSIGVRGYRSSSRTRRDARGGRMDDDGHGGDIELANIAPGRHHAQEMENDSSASGSKSDDDDDDDDNTSSNTVSSDNSSEASSSDTEGEERPYAHRLSAAEEAAASAQRTTAGESRRAAAVAAAVQAVRADAARRRMDEARRQHDLAQRRKELEERAREARLARARRRQMQTLEFQPPGSAFALGGRGASTFSHEQASRPPSNRNGRQGQSETSPQGSAGGRLDQSSGGRRMGRRSAEERHHMRLHVRSRGRRHAGGPDGGCSGSDHETHSDTGTDRSDDE